MKAKKVYEFQTSGSIIKIGIEGLFINWLKQWAPDVDYDINIKEQKIIIYGDIILGETNNSKGTIFNKFPIFMNNFEIQIQKYLDPKKNIIMHHHGNLNLCSLDITKLPPKLNYINGYLDLSNTKISKLPDDLCVFGYINMLNTPITELPKKLCVKNSWLDISNTNITKIPDELYVAKTIIAHNTNIIEISENATFDLLKVDNINFDNIPSKFHNKIKTLSK